MAFVGDLSYSLYETNSYLKTLEIFDFGLGLCEVMVPTSGLQLFPTPSVKGSSRNPSVPRDALGLQPQKPSRAAIKSRSPEPSKPLDYILGTRSPSQASNAQIASEIPRPETSLSEAPTLIRNDSNASHSSIQRPPKSKKLASTKGEPVSRSIFPRYDHSLPLEQQAYYPQQASPTQIPRSAISKRTYSPTYNGTNLPGQEPTGSPLSAGSSVRGISKGATQMLPPPEPSSTEELKHLWKVANGWRVSPSEGRSFSLKMTRYVISLKIAQNSMHKNTNIAQ